MKPTGYLEERLTIAKPPINAGFKVTPLYTIEQLLPEEPGVSVLQACRRGGLGDPPTPVMTEEAMKYWERIRGPLIKRLEEK